MNVKDIVKKNYLIILIVGLAFILRMLFFRDNFFFGFEQGRDFLKIREILTGDLTLIGPKTDIEGIFHGAFSYYVLVAPYILFRGNPYLIQVFFICLSSLSIFLLYEFVKDLFNQKTALVASFLYAISYSAIIYSRWLSNPTLVPALTIIILYLLTKLKKNIYFLIPLVVSWSLIFHLEVVVAIILIPGIFYYLLSRRVKLKIKPVLLSIFMALIVFSPYIIFNLKHDNILLNGVINLISTKKTTSFMDLSRFGEFANEIVDGYFPISRTVAFVMFCFLIVVALISKELKQNKAIFLIVIFLFTGPVFYFLMGINALRHFYVIVPIFLSIFTAWSINLLLKSKFFLLGIVIILIIFIGNVKTYKDRLPKSIGNFIYHAQHMYLADEKKLLDFIYQDSDRKEFSYEYYSIPYWKNEAWEYLFIWYGKEKYGHLPSRDKTNTFYVLIEPDESQPLYQKNWYDGMNKMSTLITTFASGKLKVEKRILLSPI